MATEVYLPICVPLDGSEPPFVDWDGTPWMETDNVWSDETEKWSTNRDAEADAEVLMNEVIARPDIYERLGEFGIDKARLTAVLGQSDNWGGMVHSFEYLTVCSVVEALWPEKEGET
jgi:hypothetical protein